ncbi:MAG: proteasome accessory factor PafA2 family protein, partial [Deltaproteobacteria bacterium]|nr:proteasome accessory factor PafA2 family protein [Deltaproteobacteria bacterium]
MAIKKILGAEIEYGVTVRNQADFDPISTSLLLVNSYPSSLHKRILWDYDFENPLMDARGFEVEGGRESPSEEENRSINRVLYNGARYYVDHAHPEYSTPECTDARELVMYEKAGDRILDASRQKAEELLGPERRILIYKNNSDRKGNSYGHHENYLMDRRIPFKQISSQLMPFVVTRQTFCGGGKVGAENQGAPVEYQLSQRADFFEMEIGLDTMGSRPIINTRDEPHADKEKYRRLHVIVGDSNMSEVSTYLKVGTTAVV